MRSSIWLGTAALLAVALSAAVACGQVTVTEVHEGFRHELAVNSGTFVMYEDVSIDYTVTNESGEPVWMWFPCSGVSIRVVVRDMNDDLMWISPDGCLDAFWDDTLDPGESYERGDTWDMFDYASWWPISEPGIYMVQGMLTAYNDPHAHIVSLPITIVDATTTVPDGDATTWSLIKALYR